MKFLSIIILGLLLSLCTSQYFTEAGTFQLVQAEAGIVEHQPGVFASVYFDKPATGGSGSLEFTVKGSTMMLGLYTSRTVLAGPGSDCENFVEYNCSHYNCTPVTQQTSSLSLPFFNVTAVPIHAMVYIDQNYWNLTSNALLAQDCSSYPNPEYGQLTSGIIGMGITGDAINNFQTNTTKESVMGGFETTLRTQRPVFSFFMSQDGNSGVLIFSDDPNRRTGSTPTATLKADTDWHVYNISSVKIGKAAVTGAVSGLIFDINAETIGFPIDMYHQILRSINASDQVNCQILADYQPTCRYTGDVSTIPAITITVQGQTITIPSSVYVKVLMQLEMATDILVLNLEGISDQNSDSSYVTYGFDNYIILNQDVLSYYYTVFDTGRSVIDNVVSSSPSIKMYVANHGKKSSALYVIIICSIIGAIIGAIVYRYKQLQKQRMTHEPLLQSRPGNQVEMDHLQGLGSR